VGIISRYDEHEPLSVDSIARAAEYIVDEEGIRALTMRRLGRELGVEAMSIYHHIPNKAALESTLVTRLLSPHDVDGFLAGSVGGASSSPDLLVERYVRSIRAALQAHPNRVPLITGQLPAQLFDAPVPHVVTSALETAGFDRSAAAWILDSCIGYVVGHALVEHSSQHATVDDDEAAFETGLRFLMIGLRSDLGIT
jgi:AcrR family transcriptional regulator